MTDVLCPPPIHAAPPAQTSSHELAPLRFGVLGAERRGKMAQYAHDPKANTFLVAACNLQVDRIQSMRERFGSDFLITSDYRELLARPEIDAVFICTPDYLHEEHAIAALKAGKSVFLEKPMAITIEGCDRILEAARNSTAKLYLGHNMRFFGVMRKMKELIDSGRIGKVQAIWCRHFVSYGGDAYFRDWHAERQFTHTLLLQKAVHDIDIIHWLAGAYTRRVVAMGKLSVYDTLPRRSPGEPSPFVEFNRANWPPKATTGYNPVIDVEDHNMALLELANGVQASYMQCHYTPDDQRNYTVIGTEGRIENLGDHSDEEARAKVCVWDQRKGYSEHGQEIHEIPATEGTHGGADPLIVQDFVDFLRGRETRGATAWDARMAVAAGYLAAESLRHGNSAREIPPERISNSKIH